MTSVDEKGCLKAIIALNIQKDNQNGNKSMYYKSNYLSKQYYNACKVSHSTEKCTRIEDCNKRIVSTIYLEVIQKPGSLMITRDILCDPLFPICVIHHSR